MERYSNKDIKKYIDKAIDDIKPTDKTGYAFTAIAMMLWNDRIKK
ncbi:hypothetical protein LCGC14_1652370 [marine sediment metagenome]|uniref:Uncharacterized protein n=1 Tax=marine sediment metagenome TaxID=412755 RepID=A0A0F9IIZ1_9ZZZZ